MLQYQNGNPFATGVLTYNDRPATIRETDPRIYLQVAFEGILTEVVVDTGTPYVICNPEIAQNLGLNPDNECPSIKMLIRNKKIVGRLGRFNVTLLAEKGSNLNIDATVFIPDLDQEWGDLPNFLGLTGFLDRLRFAIDPSNNEFYFGPLS